CARDQSGAITIAVVDMGTADSLDVW
nr:immunoglobulin heavy chain junction region [Macaca mulatta]